MTLFMYYTIINTFFIGIIFVNSIFNKSSQIIKYISKKILYITGFKYDIPDLNKLPSKIIMVGSHTSIYDFFIGLFYYYTVLHDKYDSYILMKKEFEIFCTPILMYIDKKFKLISVVPKKQGLTNIISNTLSNKNNFILFISPEGTRRCTTDIKSGYWHIAKNNNIDIVYIGIDFSNKTINLENPRKIKDNWENEKDEFIYSCKKYIPLYPERCYWTRNFYNT